MNVKMTSLFLMALLALTSTAQEETWLVREGRPEARIYLPRLCGAATRLAADELSTYIEKLTGARVPVDTYGVMSERRIKQEGRVQIRLEPRVDPVREVSADGSEDVSTLTVAADTVTLAGNSETAVLYGVYQLLADQGVRWFLPGEIGEHVPRLADLKLPRGQTTSRPSFRTREIGLSGDPPAHFAPHDFDRLLPEYALWNLRNRCMFSRVILRDYVPAGNRPREQTGHWLNAILNTADLAKEPERFPLVTKDGATQRLARGGQICFTDPRNIAETIRCKLDDFAKDPSLLTATVSLADHGGMCECPRCIAANDGRFPPLDPNLVVWKFMNAVIRGIRAEQPGKRIAFYSSYGSLRRPPAGFQAAEGIVGITANVGANGARIDDPDDPFAVGYMADILGHQAAGVAELGAREYTMFAGTPQPLVLLDQIRIYHSLGYVYYHCESMGRDELRWPVQWVQAQLLWNAAGDPAALLKECCDTLYGAAGAEALEILQAIDARERSLPRLVFGSAGVMQWILSPELVARGRATLKAAARKVAGVHARRLDRFADSFELFARQAEAVRACYQAMDDLAEPSRETALKSIAAFDKHWNDNALEETCSPQIFRNMAAFRTLITSLASPKTPAPRKGFEAPTPAQRLAALYSLLEVPAQVDDLFYLPDVWKFKPDIAREAEAKNWFAEDLDDTGWRDLSVYDFYERQGYDRYDGAYCYRVRFTAPVFPQGKRIMLRIGSLDDEGAIYVNGKLAHRRWHLVDQDWKRSFAVDVTDFIRPGAANVICIVGNDEYGVGGLWNPSALYSVNQ
jgi:hypothetical protein